MPPIQDVQGSYNTDFDIGVAGQIADTSLCDVASRIVENAVVGFGLAVGRGSADESCRLGGTGFEGITVQDKSVESDDNSVDQYAVGEMAGVLRKGTVWVTVGSAVTPASTGYFTPATGAISATASGNTEIVGAKFETSAASGDLARVYLP